MLIIMVDPWLSRRPSKTLGVQSGMAAERAERHAVRFVGHLGVSTNSVLPEWKAILSRLCFAAGWLNP